MNPPPAAPSLRILASPTGELVGQTVPLAGSGCTIGREVGNDLVLRDDAASRRHARVAPTTDGGWEVLDNGSGNGVWVNDQRTARHRLADRDVVQIGHTKLQFVAPAWQAVPAGGHDVAATAAVCGRCGNPIKPGSRFCPHCGAALQDVAPVAVPPPGWGAAPPYPPPAPPPHYGHPGYPGVAAPLPPPAIPPPPPGYGQVPGYPPGHPAAAYSPVAAPRPRASGCAIGCFALSLLLFVATVGGALWALHRTGHLQLPGFSAAPLAGGRGAETP